MNIPSLECCEAVGKIARQDSFTNLHTLTSILISFQHIYDFIEIFFNYSKNYLIFGPDFQGRPGQPPHKNRQYLKGPHPSLPPRLS
jgi:hypothetical protein